MRSLPLLLLLSGCATGTRYYFPEENGDWASMGDERQRSGLFSPYVMNGVRVAAARVRDRVRDPVYDHEAARLAELDHVVRRLLPLALEGTDAPSITEIADDLRDLEPIRDHESLEDATAYVDAAREHVRARVDLERMRESLELHTRVPLRRELAYAALAGAAHSLSGHASSHPHEEYDGLCGTGVPFYEWGGAYLIPYFAIAAGADPEEVADEVEAMVDAIVSR